MIFLDTNLLIATALPAHPHHEASGQLFATLTPKTSSIAAHTIAEVYSSLTRQPAPQRIHPEVAMAAIEVFLRRLTTIALTSEEYLETVRAGASARIAGGRIYDALLLACARKVNAERIYTWNVKHFRALAPDLHDRIGTP